jgi:hypothetical protein
MDYKKNNMSTDREIKGGETNGQASGNKGRGNK